MLQMSKPMRHLAQKKSHKSLNLWKRLLVGFCLVFVIPQLIYFGYVTVTCLSFNFYNPPANTLMVLRSFQKTRIKPETFIPYKQIPLYSRQGILYLEDHNFWTHKGIVLGAIREAYEANQRAGYTAYGGSTITQQLARTFFLIPNKNYVRKYLEAGTALIMEQCLSKERILELYLNNIEWGPGVFGIEAGAKYHFGVSVRKLTEEQQARLLAIITNPLKYNVKTFYKNRGMEARYEALMGE